MKHLHPAATSSPACCLSWSRPDRPSPVANTLTINNNNNKKTLLIQPHLKNTRISLKWQQIGPVSLTLTGQRECRTSVFLQRAAESAVWFSATERRSKTTERSHSETRAKKDEHTKLRLERKKFIWNISIHLHPVGRGNAEFVKED